MKGPLEKLYVGELKDLFSAEKQLTKALPKMAKAASSEDVAAEQDASDDQPETKSGPGRAA